MATVGIVGGLGPESTIDYYRRLLEAWERVDPTSAPSVVIDSLDVRRALHLVERDRPALVEYLLASLRRLAGAGADFAAMTANTPHAVFDALAARSPLPLVSIVEACAEEARRRGLRRLALLGTRFTMEGAFYPEVCARYGIAVVAPGDADRRWLHHRYTTELLRGEFREETRSGVVSLVGRLRDAEAIDGVILGGTELPLLLPSPYVAEVPTLDTTALHVGAIVRRLRDSRDDHPGRRPGYAPGGAGGEGLRTGNLFADAAPPPEGERFETLLGHRNLVVERIVSSAAITPREYVQPQDEWVVLVRGEAVLQVAGESVALAPGDHVFLPAGTPHTVERVSQGAIWLAVHLHPAPGGRS